MLHSNIDDGAWSALGQSARTNTGRSSPSRGAHAVPTATTAGGLARKSRLVTMSCSSSKPTDWPSTPTQQMAVQPLLQSSVLTKVSSSGVSAPVMRAKRLQKECSSSSSALPNQAHFSTPMQVRDVPSQWAVRMPTKVGRLATGARLTRPLHRPTGKPGTINIPDWRCSLVMYEAKALVQLSKKNATGPAQKK